MPTALPSLRVFYPFQTIFAESTYWYAHGHGKSMGIGHREIANTRLSTALSPLRNFDPGSFLVKLGGTSMS